MNSIQDTESPKKVSLRAKILTLVFSSILSISLFLTYQLWSLSRVAESSIARLNQDVEKVALVGQISDYFKSEVQAWKNLLIRGADSEKQAKYSKELESLSGQVDAQVQALLKTTTSEESELVREFLKNQQDLTRHYLEARDQFLKPGAFNLAGADGALHGKDRAVLDSMKKLNSLMVDQMKKSGAVQVRSGLREGVLATLVLSLLFLTGGWLFVTGLSQKIYQMIARLFDASSQVGSASGQLATASQQLASSTSQSAASLEETVASLEKLSEMVKLSQERAQEAAKVSQESHHAVQKGRSEMERVLGAMSEIAQSSKKVEEILAVIEDIAFQTNLLALNAAVEAARAGEQGKGFAVVAEAVRGLAQRSASAAKDINGLITDSATKVELGSQVVSASELALRSIVESVNKVSQMNEEIARFSGEQSEGIEQISKAMGQLDKMTQHNAAIAEESASSSEQLAKQGQVLQTVVTDLRAVV